jgi:predicted transcriptional regulator
MGMYYSLRCKLKLKKDFVPLIQSLLDSDNDDEWSNLKTEIDSIREYSKADRASFIPFGGLAYSPELWQSEEDEWCNEIVNDTWTFQCSIKTLSTIESFFQNVVPIITEVSLHIELFYEEDNNSTFYKLIEGAVIETGEMITYD